MHSLNLFRRLLRQRSGQLHAKRFVPFCPALPQPVCAQHAGEGGLPEPPRGGAVWRQGAAMVGTGPGGRGKGCRPAVACSISPTALLGRQLSLRAAGSPDRVPFQGLVSPQLVVAGDTQRCAANHAAGGWGPTSGEVAIPNKNVFVVNNVIYNPPGYRSQARPGRVGGGSLRPAGPASCPALAAMYVQGWVR